MKHSEKIIPIIAAVIIAGGLGFYGGTKYGGQNKVASMMNGGPGGQGFAGGQRGVAAGGRSMAGGGFTGGEILAKDAESITVKMRDGGSKIILLAPSTQVLKSTSGSVNDLTVGEQVTVTGTANPDGSISGQFLQIRPAMPAGAPTTPRTN